MENFFNYCLFSHHAAYVLYGDKPLCEFSIHPEVSDEKEWELWNALPKEVKANVIWEKPDYSIKICWETWKSVRDRFKINQYLIVERPFEGDPTSCWIYFVNIEKTALLLSDNYTIFRDVLGREFEPLEEVFEIDNPKSNFWNIVLKNHITKGLLCGYGKRNSYFFNWMVEYQKNPNKVGEYFKTLSFDFSSKEKVDHFRANATNFTIPVYRSLPQDPTIAAYEAEKKQIKETYKNKDFLETTLLQLTR